MEQEQKGISMKTPIKRLSIGLALLAAIAILAVACDRLTKSGSKKGRVAYEEQTVAVIIHPGTAISDDDMTKLNEVLAAYDRSVYRIDTLSSGKVTSDGTLGDMYIDQTILSEEQGALAAGGSVKAVQIITLMSPSSVSKHPPQGPLSPTPQPAGPTSVSKSSPVSEVETPQPAVPEPSPPTSVSKSSSVSKMETPQAAIPEPSPPSSVSKPKISVTEAQALVEQVKKILDKYTK
jgi:hypothetical protein